MLLGISKDLEHTRYQIETFQKRLQAKLST
jgi:hypothetical protein